MKELIPIERIENKIYLIRGEKMMLDRDLAELYRVDTAQLKRQVKRNVERFPRDFMFKLTEKEVEQLVCQIGIPSKSYFGGALPFAFTEHGILMLSSVLKSKTAISINIQIMRIFLRLRNLLSTHKRLAEKLKAHEKRFVLHDSQISSIFKIIKKLIYEPEKPKRKIGFFQIETNKNFKI